jgi:hypothetical protein
VLVTPDGETPEVRDELVFPTGMDITPDNGRSSSRQRLSQQA